MIFHKIYMHKFHLNHPNIPNIRNRANALACESCGHIQQWFPDETNQRRTMQRVKPLGDNLWISLSLAVPPWSSGPMPSRNVWLFGIWWHTIFSLFFFSFFGCLFQSEIFNSHHISHIRFNGETILRWTAENGSPGPGMNDTQLTTKSISIDDFKISKLLFLLFLASLLIRFPSCSYRNLCNRTAGMHLSSFTGQALFFYIHTRPAPPPLPRGTNHGIDFKKFICPPAINN